MNIKQLELQAKALAPVIRQFVEQAVSQVKTELEALHNTEISQLKADFAEKLAQAEQKIPDPVDKIAWLEEIADAIKNQQFITAEDAGLIMEQRAGELMAHMDKRIEELPTPKDGESVTVEDVLPAIEAKIAEKMAEIPAAKDGKDGIDGKNGRDGIDGKDALQLEVLPSVDMQKSFPRGTYALHNGGLIRAYQQTQGENGWETVQNGIADTQITQLDARNFTIACRHTNGRVTEQAFSMPALIYRNIYQEGKDYQQGDVVTFGGSLWHCDKDTQTKPGTKDSDWSLAAKKGRDGKDGSIA